MPTEFELNTTMHEKTIIPTKNTPEISLNPDGIIKITGRSMNGKITEFEEQIENWIDEYIINPPELTCVHIKLEYFDEINLKIYYSLLKKIESIKSKDKKFIINWYYEEDDEDILEKGEKISTILDIPFNFMMIGDSVLDECNSPIMNS
jgi:hypothetical protein